MNDELMLQAELSVLEAELALASMKANPYHDPKTGKFAPKVGGKKFSMATGGGAGGQGQKPAKSEDSAFDKAQKSKFKDMDDKVALEHYGAPGNFTAEQARSVMRDFGVLGDRSGIKLPYGMKEADSTIEGGQKIRHFVAMSPGQAVAFADQNKLTASRSDIGKFSVRRVGSIGLNYQYHSSDDLPLQGKRAHQAATATVNDNGSVRISVRADSLHSDMQNAWRKMGETTGVNYERGQESD